MNGEKHVLTSKTIQGALAALFGMALPAISSWTGLTVTSGDGHELVDALSTIVTALGSIYAIYGRVVATRRISI